MWPLVALGAGILVVALLISYAAFVVDQWFQQTFEQYTKGR